MERSGITGCNEHAGIAQADGCSLNRLNVTSQETSAVSESETFRLRKMLARDRTFFATGSLLFIASSALTIYFCRSMSSAMPMPGGWTMSMAWMRMPGQGWLNSAAMFLGMWLVMMAAMMLPSLIPILLVYRCAIAPINGRHLFWLTVIVSAAYFFVWTGFGIAAYGLGVALTSAAMRWLVVAQEVPVATAFALLFAGLLQLTKWKASQIRRCRDLPTYDMSALPDSRSAWSYGCQLGIDCCLCCCGYMLALLVLGVMNWAAMAVLAVAITLERIVVRPKRIARIAGLMIVAGGTFQMVQALRGLH